MLPQLRPPATQVRTTTTAAARDPIPGPPSPVIERSRSLLPSLRPLRPPATRALSAITTAAAAPGPVTGPPNTGQTQSTTTAAVPPHNPGWIHDANRPHFSQLPPDWRDPITGANRHGHIPNPNRHNRRRRLRENGAWRASNPEEARQALEARTRRWEQRRRG